MLMLDGRLRYHRALPAEAPRKERFPFTFDGASIERLCAAGQRTPPMAIKAAAAELRWKQQTALSMLCLGEMQALPGKAKLGATLIAREEVARAKRDYTTTAQVGARLFPNPPLNLLRMLAWELRRRGLKPVAGDGGAAGRTGQLIWRAADVAAVGLDLVLMLFLGIGSLCGNLCVNQSLRMAPASVVVPYQYTLTCFIHDGIDVRLADVA
jgi:hypothetical protein